MTREEAIADLEDKIKRLNEIMENGDCGCVDQYTWERYAKQVGWYEEILEALEEPSVLERLHSIPDGGSPPVITTTSTPDYAIYNAKTGKLEEIQ
jgi:hypothetical protein